MTGEVLVATVGALAASACFGTAAVLQAIGARSTTRGRGIDPSLLWRLSRSLPFVAGIGLDLLGFGLALVAMRTLPLFAVEAIFASYVGVAAALATWLLKARLRAQEWAALGVAAGGLALLALSVGSPATTAAIGTTQRWAVLATAFGLGGAAAAAARMRSPAGAGLVAVMGGLQWGLLAIGVRVLREPGSLAGLLTDPAAYAVPVAGGLGLLAYTTALQRISVTAATALVIVGETVVPATVGLLLLGDRPRPGAGGLAVAGFVLSVGAALALARHGEIEPGVGAGTEPAVETVP